MNRIAWLFFALIVLNGASAQPTISPSAAKPLKKELAQARTDTARVLVLDKLTRCYTSIDLDTALLYGRKGLELAVRKRYQKGILLCALSTGYVLSRTNDFVEGLGLFFEAKQLSERQNLPVYQAIALTNIASVYGRTKEYEKAFTYVKEARDLLEKYGISEKQVSISLLSGTLFLNMGKIDSAGIYLEKAYEVGTKFGIPAYSTAATYYLGELHFEKKQLDSALYFYKKSVALSQRYQVKYTITRAYQGLAEVFLQRNQLDSTVFYCNKALAEQKADAFSLLTVRNANNLLSRVYETRNQPEEALRYFKLAYAASDSLNRKENTKQVEKLNFEEQERETRTQRRIEANQKAFQKQIEVYILSGIVLIILIIALILHRNNRQKQKANSLLHQQKNEIEVERTKAEHALQDLKSTQAQLIQAEKMASLGELTAGIAHEIQNPLNFVNNYSEVSKEMMEELVLEREKLPGIRDENLVVELMRDIDENLIKIHHHGKRADAIVKSMLEHSRSSRGEPELSDLNYLVDEYLQLAYHGQLAKDAEIEIKISTDFDNVLPKVELIPQDIGRVLINLFTNAFYACTERSRSVTVLTPDQKPYRPEIKVSTRQYSDRVELRIQDNGNGIPAAIKDKIFQPFFTTKPTGQGTGLGLSLAYDIVKAHGGELRVESEEGEGTVMIIRLPVI